MQFAIINTTGELYKGGENRGKQFPPRPVVAINLTTGERHHFASMYRALKELGFVSSTIQLVCEGIQRSTRSKFDDYWYRFEYLG